MLFGTIVNAGAVLAGTLLGCLVKKGLPERLKSTLMQALGLCTILIGILSAIETKDPLCVIVSMALGTLLGSAVGIEKGLGKLGSLAERLVSRDADTRDGAFGKAFVTSSLLFCVGAMSIVGSLESGLKGDHTTLLAKSVLDGVASIIFASTLGPGVALSAMTVLVYQGGITLASGVCAPALSAAVINEMSAAGGLVVLGIGVNLLLDKKIRVGDMLPAFFLPLLYLLISGGF